MSSEGCTATPREHRSVPKVEAAQAEALNIVNNFSTRR